MYAERQKLYLQLANERQAGVIALVTGDRPGLETQIAPDSVQFIGDLLDRYQDCKKISLILYTRGGDTLAAWSLVNLLREFCGKLEIIIPAKCHSAGTLICLGADQLVMTKQATLGPIDPSVNTPVNPAIPGKSEELRLPVSVEDIAGFIEMAKKEGGLNSQEQLGHVYMQLANAVHPVALGRVQRARGQIQKLAAKLLSMHMTKKGKIKSIVRTLCTEAGSHDYMIYRTEARKQLGLSIETPSPNLYNLIKAIYQDFRDEMGLDYPYNPAMLLGEHDELDYEIRRVLIETQNDGGFQWVRRGNLKKNKQEITDPAGTVIQNIVQISDTVHSDKWEKIVWQAN